MAEATRRPRSRGAKREASAPLISASHVKSYLLEHAAQIAPADVETLLSREEEIRRKASCDSDRHELFHRRLDVALQLLRDHARRRCPQIPYHTVSLLAAALFYWLEPLDAIPDFIPGIGTSDDALVLAMAWQLGAAGLDRYCTWKDIPREDLLGKSLSAGPRTAAPRRRS
jgi:uncharacterized membrane protein YkvA (DUF1232 family)